MKKLFWIIIILAIISRIYSYGKAEVYFTPITAEGTSVLSFFTSYH